MAPIKELGGGGEERKETVTDKPRGFENRPLGLSCLSLRLFPLDVLFLGRSGLFSLVKMF